MGLAEDIKRSLAESIVDLPNAEESLIEGKDIDVEFSDLLAFLLRRQRVLENAMLEIARQLDEGDH